MQPSQEAIDSAIRELDKLRKLLLRNRSFQQVRTIEETSVINATAQTWFNNHRPLLASVCGEPSLTNIDEDYREMLSWSSRAVVRSRYFSLLKALRAFLVDLRSQNILKLAAPLQQTSDQPPAFAPLISDVRMQAILVRRWNECVGCLSIGAPLAANVMMGGLLEALLLSRIHRESSKAKIFAASSAPKDRKSGRPLQLQEWTLHNYIDVAHELGWISHSAKDVGQVLMDYRNYIHPYKELSHGIVLKPADALVLWEVGKSISKQILASI
ncbi:MAG TPA: hypothetical protein VGT03_04340 [Candidatus Acidoferrales bacterium]|nr:hypothetical protein [Candidatus Acidoferrales bacterium]